MYTIIFRNGVTCYLYIPRHKYIEHVTVWVDEFSKALEQKIKNAVPRKKYHV